MVKEAQIAFRIDEDQKKDMEKAQKELGFNNLTTFILFLFDKFQSERGKK